MLRYHEIPEYLPEYSRGIRPNSPDLLIGIPKKPDLLIGIPKKPRNSGRIGRFLPIRNFQQKKAENVKNV